MYSKRKAMRKYKSISAIHHVERNLSSLIRSSKGKRILDSYVRMVRENDSFYLRDVFLLKGKEVYLFIPIGFPYVQVGYRGPSNNLTRSITENLLSFGIAATLRLNDDLLKKRKEHSIKDDPSNMSSQVKTVNHHGRYQLVRYASQIQCYG